MIGTITNTCAILLGSILGSLLKKGIKKEYQEALYTAMGLAALVLGINAAVQNMPKSEYPVLFIVSLALGSLIGRMIDLEKRFYALTNRFSGGNLGEGLSTAILLFCIGSLSILGPVEARLNKNYTFLFTNAALDFVTSTVLASAYGAGIAAAAGVLFCWQGSIYLAAGFLADFFTEGLLSELSVVGGVLIAASGLSILKIKDCKTVNMLPSLFVPVVWFMVLSLF